MISTCILYPLLYSQVREAELKKDEVEEKLKVAKEELKKKREAGDDSG